MPQDRTGRLLLAAGAAIGAALATWADRRWWAEARAEAARARRQAERIADARAFGLMLDRLHRERRGGEVA